MNKLSIAMLLFFIGNRPANAQFGAIVSGAQYAQQAAFQAFMKIQLIQELEVLRQNYTSSVNYYNQFKQLNSGRGFLFNMSQQFKTAEDESIQQMSYQLLNSYNDNTATDQFIQQANQTVYNDMKYAGDELANVVSNRKTAISVAQNAGNLAPKDAANLSAKSQGLELQMLIQLHEDNLRLIQLSAMGASSQNKQQKSQADMIQSISHGLQNRLNNTGGGQ